MNNHRYLDGILTVIAVLLLVLVLRGTALGPIASSQLAPPAYAASTVPSTADDWVFFPVGNQEVRRLVIWDKTTNTVYDYDSHGGLDNTWVIPAPGQRIQKK